MEFNNETIGEKNNEIITSTSIPEKIINRINDETEKTYWLTKQKIRDLRNKLVQEFGEYDHGEVLKYWQTKKENHPIYSYEQALEQIFSLDPALSELDHFLEQSMQSENSEEKRNIAIQNLKEKLEKLFAERNYICVKERHSNGKTKDEFPLSIKNFKKYKNDRLEIKINDSSYIENIFAPYLEAILINDSKKLIRKKIGNFSFEKFSKDKELFGAKGAFLLALKRIQNTKKIPEMIIPDFTNIPTDLYTKWKNGEDVYEELASYYPNYKTKKDIIIRSSAVYSEDNESSTGAGIYDSIVISKKSTVKHFVQMILKIYQSTESEHAKKYRTQNNINDEKMGIVVQEHIRYFEHLKGYINSIMLNRPELMEIVYDSGLRPIIDKKKLEEKCYVHNRNDDIYHYQFDYRKKGSWEIEKLSELALKLETFFKFPIQIEFAVDSKDHNNIYIFQSRFLPKIFSKKLLTEFPKDEIPILQGLGIGSTDQELTVLDGRDNNEEKEGLVLFYGSEYVTLMEESELLKRFPKSGAVLVLMPSRLWGGHIETICAEKNITLIFNTGGQHFYEYINKKVRVISNGLEAKIYTATK